MYDPEASSLVPPTPLIHPEFKQNALDAGDALKACVDCSGFDVTSLQDSEFRLNKIARKDVQDFHDLWFRPLAPNTNPELCGYCTITDWPQIGENAVMIVQYESLRICVRAGASGGETIVSTNDIRALLNSYLETFQDEDMPPCVSHSMCGVKPFEWLIMSTNEYARQHPTGWFRPTVFQDPETFDLRTIKVGSLTLQLINSYHHGREWQQWYQDHLPDAQSRFVSAKGALLQSN